MRKTKINTYPVTIESCEEGGFFAKCTSFQGCHAEGETYGEAIDNIGEVIRAHIGVRENLRKKNYGELSSILKFRIPVPIV